MAANRENAFTLIEVLIALAILAIALFAIVFAMEESVKQTVHIKDKMAADWVAMNILNSVQADMIAIPSSGDHVQGSSNLFDNVWNWELGIDPAQEATNAYFVRIYVSVKKAGSDNIIEKMEGYARLKTRSSFYAH